MEADPVYKMLEDKFYKVFDEHIIAHNVEDPGQNRQFREGKRLREA